MSRRSLSSRVKITLLKGMEVIGTSASNLASTAKLRVNEINLETRRREILTDFSLQAFELWQKGVQLPDSLSEMLTELSDIEYRLSVLHAQKYAKVAGTETKDTASVPAQNAPCACESPTDSVPADAFPLSPETAPETSAFADIPGDAATPEAVIEDDNLTPTDAATVTDASCAPQSCESAPEDDSSATGNM
jgi:hypothetical protein